MAAIPSRDTGLWGGRHLSGQRVERSGTRAPGLAGLGENHGGVRRPTFDRALLLRSALEFFRCLAGRVPGRTAAGRSGTGFWRDGLTYDPIATQHRPHLRRPPPTTIDK